MIKFFRDENWKELDFVSRSGLKYALSNHGRVVSFTTDIANGKELKCGRTKGYKVFKFVPHDNPGGVKVSKYVHKLVAEHFLPAPKPSQTYVLHLNYSKEHNFYKNLCWASKEEMEAHQSLNPSVISNRAQLQESNRKSNKVIKLTEEKVRVLKRKLADPNRKTRLKMLARQFGISEMQLYRIKSGENWGHVTV